MDKEIITTEYKIDKITYIVKAYTSENATDTLHTKIDKLILRDMRRDIENNAKNLEYPTKTD